ncbi:uncharacterized protein STEHIDRAFT_163727 [Stereum hirsutum FP-91666 SS1]|uniref:Uncharacterized protein n=1 Tax=Stereum hirsutum (strain FP-91666) TaxID=721885 RepID=R7RWZ4_STEHR|nr:uncharacterized protein STEHIDRAFT_163727 [Stereum hirsutum FP-91666 SS1]EIM79370.1 hypothetical protein STEHIDRAFT_163727 [Stereum hirsutum FP-91666 SS1]
MRSQILVLALCAIFSFAAPSPAENEIAARGCPGGGPGNACPEGLFQKKKGDTTSLSAPIIVVSRVDKRRNLV